MQDLRDKIAKEITDLNTALERIRQEISKARALQTRADQILGEINALNKVLNEIKEDEDEATNTPA